MSNGDDTEYGIAAITKGLKPEEKLAAARLLRRNSMVSKIIIYGTMTVLTAFLGAIGAHFGGLI